LTIERSPGRPPFLSSPKLGDVVLVEVINDSGEKPRTKVRTAVVVDFDLDAPGGPFFVVVWGTKTQSDDAVPVRRGDEAHEQARLSEEVTYFGPRGREFCELADMWPKEGTENALKLALRIRQKLKRGR